MRAIVRRLLMLWSSARLKGRVRLAVAPGSRVDLRRIDAQDDCHVAVGPNSLISARISFDRSGATFRCGARCYIGASHMVVAQAIEMGDDVVISWGVTIVDHNSHAVDWDHRARDVLDWADNRKNWDHVKVAPVRLQDKVWVGFNAIILKGVTVGEGAVVAAGDHVVSTAADLPAFFDLHPLHHRYGGENAHPVAFYQQAISGAGFAIERVFGSLDSPINFGPQSERDVHRRIAAQLMPVAMLRPLVAGALDVPAVGRHVRRLASRLDRRPGRHASFVARKRA